ncbi:MAG: IS5 family transposase [Clostridia bacterium]|nr:IS5 family transposase [Clostridia bacterium]
MYKFDNGQISLEDFGQPVGMNLKNSNRWVKRAQTIPWIEIEKKYAKLFSNKKGNVAKSLRLGLGARIIQAEYGYSDAEIPLQIQENPYLQYFCGYKAFDDSKPPFDPSMMVYFRKRLIPEIIGEINEMVIAAEQAKQAKAEETAEETNDSDDDDKNSGTMIVDATCAPSQITYPQDVSLLNQARECSEKIIDELHVKGEQKPRTYRKKAHKDYTSYSRSRKPKAKQNRKAIGKQLGYLKRNISSIEKMIADGKQLPSKYIERFSTIQTIYSQQKEMFDNHTHSVKDRIVSLSQPWIRPIVRGKAKAKVEFGVKLDISVCDGWTRLERHSFDAYNESTGLQDMIEQYRKRTGHYPERVLADKIYRTRDNLSYCKQHSIRLSGPALGRPKKDAVIDKKQNYIDECERIEVERKFSLAKRKCGMGMIVTRLKETTCHSIAMSVLLLNLRKIEKLRMELLLLFMSKYRLAIIQ